jgi:hypothetical protein
MITAYHGTGSSPSQIKKYGLKPLDFDQVAKDILARYKHRKIPKWVYKHINNEIGYRKSYQEPSIHLTLSKRQAEDYSGSSGGEFSRQIEGTIRDGLKLKKMPYKDTAGYVVAVSLPEDYVYRGKKSGDKETLREYIDRLAKHDAVPEDITWDIPVEGIKPKDIIGVEKVNEPKVKAKKFDVIRLEHTPTGMVVKKRQKDGSWAVVTTEKGEPMKMYHGTRKGKIEQFKPKYSPMHQVGFGVHFTPDKSFAELYAFNEAIARRGSKPFVNEAYLDINKLLDARQIVKEGSVEFEIAEKLAGKRAYKIKDENGVPSIYLKNAIDEATPQKAEKVIKEYGYDGILYEAVMGISRWGDTKAPTYVVLNPQQVIHKGGYTKTVAKTRRKTVSVGGVR